VTKGLAEYELGDEQHYVFFDGYHSARPLPMNIGTDLGGHSGPSHESCAGFVFEHGTGRVCYVGSAHTLQGMRHPMVQRLYENAIRWLLRRDAAGL
jgi:hypothetical protein